ncbi:glycosyltransferase family 2 protein [Spongiivirga citrea]|uniref:Glycosyltransferase n=1 Tax=Spongiivirga citrea TaxID=1481457 RepID=A0A6M0CEI8_9FLAO|nr:glycosyltransferase family 2 protein [Spongiivirga citrea]NER16161.1 glycosyltransferase [Spongiivirga citrea]
MVQAPTKKQVRALRFLIIVGVLTTINFFYWFLNPDLIGYKPVYIILVITMAYSYSKVIYEWYHYWDISVPDEPNGNKKFTVDVLTTFFPGEPYDMIIDTLTAIQKMPYPHTTYLCDEANDPFLKEQCKRLGVIHVTRDNRIDAKAGNINNALKQATGEICLILDPDHMPQPNFLDQVLPHFENSELGYVQTVQAYSNLNESYVAKGAAQQTFQFYGPMMMCMNSYGTVNAIGANCVFRRAALDSIGGHAAGLSEDMHTAMKLHAKGWKSIYVPKVFTLGLVPSNITAYYKQQLKWSRGTLELLVTTYPKIFRKLSLRQKLHYGLIPFHYLIGIIYLINFLIPIISLLTCTYPWKGNMVMFGIIILPLVFSVLLIRSYVQRWVMNERERGYHIIGGLLQISTWWVYCLGLFYTIIRKKIPYLPTPKDDSDQNNWPIVFPNLIIAAASIFAINYGLSIDWTPFNVFMSGFALLNTFFMLFSVYLARHEVGKYAGPNANAFQKKYQNVKLNIKIRLWNTRHILYDISRRFAVPILVGALLLSGGLLKYHQYTQWDGVKADKQFSLKPNYTGIFLPTKNDGLSNIETISAIEESQQTHFDIHSLYLAWGDDEQFPEKLVSSIYDNQSIPMITWEPWASTFQISDSIDQLKNNQKIFKHINEGFFDDYITSFALKIKASKKPLFLRFAHEFDNPAYPWSPKGKNTAGEFRQAWRYVHNKFSELNVTNAIWVWNPWKADAIADYFPGKEYIDWVGLTVLNYENNSFEDLYDHFKTELKYTTNAPIMIAEFGSLGSEEYKNRWISDALSTIKNEHDEINALVYFNSNVDTNVPDALSADVLKWDIENFGGHNAQFTTNNIPSYTYDELVFNTLRSQSKIDQSIFTKPIKGVNYKKGSNWYKDHYVLNRINLIEDFTKMKSLGINTLQYFGPGIYDKNVLSISAEQDLDVIYSFWIEQDIDFIADKSTLDALSKKITKTVKYYKNDEHIISWNIGNDVFKNLYGVFDKPVLQHQQMAYLNWARDLISKINVIDDRPIFIDIEVNDRTLYQLEKMTAKLPSSVNYALRINDDSKNIAAIVSYFKKNKMTYYLSSISVNKMLESDLVDENVCITNWQDQFENNRLSFDGLYNQKGLAKPTAIVLQNKWSGVDIDTRTSHLLQPHILKYAKPTYAGNQLAYRAMFLKDDGNWVYGKDLPGRINYQWSMVKMAGPQAAIASKILGTGPNISIIIPEKSETYQLLLEVQQNGVVTSTMSTLNTELISK